MSATITERAYLAAGLAVVVSGFLWLVSYQQANPLTLSFEGKCASIGAVHYWRMTCKKPNGSLFAYPSARLTSPSRLGNLPIEPRP